MGRTLAKIKKISAFFYAFVALAVVFLAVGLGTLGSFDTAGKSYELAANTSDSSSGPFVIFYLPSSVKEKVKNDDGTETEKSTTVRLVNVYVNAAAVYTDVGGSAGLEIGRSSSATGNFSATRLTGTLYNIGSAEGKPAPYEWAAPFNFGASGGWTLTSHYIRLKSTTCNILLNEVVFVGEKQDASNRGTGELVVIPAEISVAPPAVGETAETTQANAAALLDAQELPPAAQSSYARFTDAERPVLLSVTEMRAGNSYFTDKEGKLLHSYEGDRVYGAFGIDLIALGTLMFGISPFGLRFFPMLASFGILVVGYFFVKRLAKSDFAGFAFAALYSLCNLSFSLGHVGTPLTIGLFFFVAALSLCHRFYAQGMKRASVLSAAPLFFSGVFALAAIAVNGVFVIPFIGVAALFALGMVRQRKARRHYLDAAIAEAEAEPEPVPVPGEETVSEGRKKVAGVVAEYRYKAGLSLAAFLSGLVIGFLAFSLLCLLPARFLFIKLYDDPAAPTRNIFYFVWKSFAGGFAGVNPAASSVWAPFFVLFEGTGSVRAATGAVVNAAASVAGAFGIVYALVRIAFAVKAAFQGKFGREERTALRRTLVPLGLLVFALISAAVGQGGLAFVFLAYIAAFMLAGEGIAHLYARGGAFRKGAVIACIAEAVLLVALFALFAVFTFSIPVSAEFLTAFRLG